MWTWNWYATVATIAWLLAWAFAAFIFAASRRRTQDRRLAALIFVEGASLTAGAGLLFFTTDLRVAHGLQAVFQSSLMATPWLYLRFIATLNSRLSRWLRNGIVDAGLIAGAIASVVLVMAKPHWFFTGFKETFYAPLDAELGPLMLPAVALGGLVGVFGLIVAIDLYRTSTGPAKRRARSFLIAFGIRDGGIIAVLGIAPLVVPLPPTGQWTDLIFVWGTSITTTIALGVATHGILQAQLFDLEVRIKEGVGRASVVGIFALITVILSEALETTLARDANAVISIAAGVVAAVLLRGVAMRLIDRWMPDVESEERLATRRHEVYLAAYQGAMEDGEISSIEHTVLDRVRDSLGLSVDDAKRIVAGARLSA